MQLRLYLYVINYTQLIVGLLKILNILKLFYLD